MASSLVRCQHWRVPVPTVGGERSDRRRELQASAEAAAAWPAVVVAAAVGVAAVAGLLLLSLMMP